MSEHKVSLGIFDMLRSLYDYRAMYAKTLTFRQNEYFILHQANTKHKNWWQVINEQGEMGFIPSNYIETITVNPDFFVQFIDNCLNSLQKNASEKESATNEELILRLNEKKRLIEDDIRSSENNLIGPEPGSDLPPLLFRNSDGNLHTITSNSTISNSVENIDVSNENLSNSVKPSVTECNNIMLNPENVITEQAVYDLVENVRVNTHLSHELSKVAVSTIVRGLQDILPSSIGDSLSSILALVDAFDTPQIAVETTHDSKRLKVIIEELTSCKEDSQQRSWMLHEDETVIKEYITELTSILSNADPNISRHAVAMDHYHVVTTLIQYYQMEVRWSIRQLLLQVYGIMCTLDQTVVKIMLNSILPGELARDMKANATNVPRLKYSAFVLTMIFSLGEPMPIMHLDYLGIDFITFLLNLIENPPETDIDEQIPDLFLNFIVSYNLQFESPKENVVLKTLQQVPSAKTFTEKILLLLNREEDPVQIFETENTNVPHSVVKMFIDMFSNETTASIFYTNDIKVLIDIVVRQLSDLSAGEKRRQQYLELCRRVMRNTNYHEHLHRKEDILKCFTRIFCEELEESKDDQRLIREISNEFPQYFK